jgi:hypothetical protein
MKGVVIYQRGRWGQLDNCLRSNSWVFIDQMKILQISSNNSNDIKLEESSPRLGGASSMAEATRSTATHSARL